MSSPLLLLFDGNAIVHRAFHAFGATRYRQATPLTVSRTGEIVSVDNVRLAAQWLANTG